MAQLEDLMHEHFIEYASYFILDRAIPDLRDGLKPVQRRILHTLFTMSDGRYHKVANVIGETMKLHPHGDASIADALVVLANKDYFIDRQGNFGNLLTGHPAAAARYIECRLTPLALDTLFFEPLTEFIPSYDGRNKEPVFLPSKLPVVLMLGTEGIAVGLSTKILPHNLKELWQAQIALLGGEAVELLPDFQQGGLMDVAAYDDGRGKVEVRARIREKDAKHVVIEEVPYGTTTESLIASIEAAVQKGRVKLASIDDFTTDKVEIELTLARGVNADEVIPQLYAYTDCSVSVSSNLNVVSGRRPISMTVSEILQVLTVQLKAQLKAELEYERGQLVDRQHWLTLEQIFVENRVYKRIEEATTDEAVKSEVMQGMAKFKKLFVRPMVEEDVKRLLELRIRRISAYDIEKNRREVDDIVRQIKKLNSRLRNMTKTTVSYVEDLIEKYGDDYPRRTEVTRIEAVDKKAVARQNIKLSYDRESGFFGSAVRGDHFRMSVSEFDLVLGISSDGTYRVMPPVDKVFFSGKLVHCAPFDPEAGVEFVVVYRDKKKIAFGKRIKIHRFIRNREYQLIKERAGKLDLLIDPDTAGVVELGFTPMKRQRVTSGEFDLSILEPTSPTSRGRRLAAKPVNKVKHSPAEKLAKAPKPAMAAKPRGGAKKPPPRSGGGGQGALF
ncbi:MAG: DNA topoisomerase IV subunit A [Deltaproteobacteria bacterium]|nr:DNA topoisomerase IV subunit A [Deltaproteobacteria bacterium]